MDDNPTAKRRALQIIIFAAQMLGRNPLMLWDELEMLTRYMRLVQEGHECPSLEELLLFLSSIPYEYSRQLFKAVRILMETMTNKGVSFGKVMEYYVRMENEQNRRRYVNDGPPPIPGVPAQVYSLDRWKLVKQMHELLSSLRPVTRSVLSSSCTMIVSPSARYGFYIGCAIHGMNPRLKLVTVSPGMCYIFVRNLLANGAESRQNCSQIKRILALDFGLNPRMLQMMLQYI